MSVIAKRGDHISDLLPRAASSLWMDVLNTFATLHGDSKCMNYHRQSSRYLLKQLCTVHSQSE